MQLIHVARIRLPNKKSAPLVENIVALYTHCRTRTTNSKQRAEWGKAQVRMLNSLNNRTH